MHNQNHMTLLSAMKCWDLLVALFILFFLCGFTAHNKINNTSTFLIALYDNVSHKN
uniref:Uncharacterized protein n=1 Tax=Arundo donax TaxID=35708 RepID=A0A0A9A212_ARUDO